MEYEAAYSYIHTQQKVLLCVSSLKEKCLYVICWKTSESIDV